MEYKYKERFVHILNDSSYKSVSLNVCFLKTYHFEEGYIEFYKNYKHYRVVKCRKEYLLYDITDMFSPITPIESSTIYDDVKKWILSNDIGKDMKIKNKLYSALKMHIISQKHQETKVLIQAIENSNILFSMNDNRNIEIFLKVPGKTIMNGNMIIVKNNKYLNISDDTSKCNKLEQDIIDFYCSIIEDNYDDIYEYLSNKNSTNEHLLSK